METKKLSVKEMCDISVALNSIKISTLMKYRDARRFNELKSLFSNRASLAYELEVDMIGQYGGAVNDDGIVSFKSQSDADAFVAARVSSMNEVDEVCFETADLSSYIDNISLTPEAIGILDGIVVFEKGAE